jgi:predicted flap endonuclease-1-like 5' DNA nuclease
MARRLNDIGIVAMADLAAIAPDRLNALPGITEAAARSWIGQARVLAGIDDVLDVP